VILADLSGQLSFGRVQGRAASGAARWGTASAQKHLGQKVAYCLARFPAAGPF